METKELLLLEWILTTQNSDLSTDIWKAVLVPSKNRIKQVTEIHKIGGFLNNLFDSRELAENADCNNKSVPFDILDYVFL